jgi:hypothetical protein
MTSGDLRFEEEDGLGGMTSNSTIFEKQPWAARNTPTISRSWQEQNARR